VTLLGPLLSLGGFLLYFVVVLQGPYFRYVPWEFLGISTLGVALAVWRLWRAPARAAVLAAVVAFFGLGLSSWYFFSLSVFDRREDRPAVGDVFPEFALPTSSRGTFRLVDGRGHYQLLLFYRGAW
jgi:hypothetical protein